MLVFTFLLPLWNTNLAGWSFLKMSRNDCLAGNLARCRNDAQCFIPAAANGSESRIKIGTGL
jgi:hypothetical protein